MEEREQKLNQSLKVSRRQFILMAGATVAGGLLPGCRPARQIPSSIPTEGRRFVPPSLPAEAERTPTPPNPKANAVENEPAKFENEFARLHQNLLRDYLDSHSGKKWGDGNTPDSPSVDAQENPKFCPSEEFGRSPQVEELSKALWETWNETFNWESHMDKFSVHACDFLQFALILNYLSSNTNLPKRLADLGKIEFGKGIDYRQPASSLCSEVPLVLTPNAWKSLQHNHVTQLNLALVFTTFLTENGGHFPGLLERLQTGEGMYNPFNAHLGAQALGFGIEGANCHHMPENLPHQYRNVVVTNRTVKEGKPVETISQASDRVVFMLTPLIFTLRCFGDPSLTEGMKELSIYKDHNLRKPRVSGIIGQYNPDKSWSKLFKNFYRALVEFSDKWPEWGFLVERNLMQEGI